MTNCLSFQAYHCFAPVTDLVAGSGINSTANKNSTQPHLPGKKAHRKPSALPSEFNLAK